MTVATLQRCRACGRHKPADAFAGRSRQCRDCVNAKVRERRRAKRERERDDTAGGGRRRAAPPEPAGRPEGRADAVWHECDGADVHPDHREVHRAGFWTEGHLVSRFIRRYCVFPDGPRIGQPAEVLPWIEELLLELYRLRPDGLRLYRRALIGTPKKNSKSTLLAWIGLYHTIADPRSGGPPDNVCAASCDDQADIVYRLARVTCESGEGALHARPDKNLAAWTEVWDAEILVPSVPQARLRRLAVGGGRLDGPNLYFRGVDEIHEWITAAHRNTFRVLSQGGVLRRQPLMVCITTAGWDKESLAFGLYEHGRRCLENPKIDPTFFFYWWGAREESDGSYAGRGPYEAAKAGDPLDYRSREAFESANPGAGTLLRYDDYLADCQFEENKESDQRRYRLNQWTEAEDLWLPQGALEACRLAEPPTLLPEARNVAAVDASTRYDSTAIVAMSAAGDGSDMRVRLHSRVWERPIDPRTGRPVEDWLIPIDEVTWHLHSLHRGTATDDDWCEGGRCRCCGLEVPVALEMESIGFDPAYVTWAAASWEKSGLPVLEIPQSNRRMVPATTALYELIVSRRLTFGADPTIERHYRGAQAKMVGSEGARLVKRKGAHVQIDAAIASAMCAYLLSQDRPEEFRYFFV